MITDDVDDDHKTKMMILIKLGEMCSLIFSSSRGEGECNILEWNHFLYSISNN